MTYDDIIDTIHTYAPCLQDAFAPGTRRFPVREDALIVAAALRRRAKHYCYEPDIAAELREAADTLEQQAPAMQEAIAGAMNPLVRHSITFEAAQRLQRMSYGEVCDVITRYCPDLRHCSLIVDKQFPTGDEADRLAVALRDEAERFGDTIRQEMQMAAAEILREAAEAAA